MLAIGSIRGSELDVFPALADLCAYLLGGPQSSIINREVWRYLIGERRLASHGRGLCYRIKESLSIVCAVGLNRANGLIHFRFIH